MNDSKKMELENSHFFISCLNSTFPFLHSAVAMASITQTQIDAPNRMPCVLCEERGISMVIECFS